MKKVLFSIMYLFITCTQVFAESSVWKAEKEGSIFYLGGTCHLLKPSDFPLPPEFDRAYQASDALIFETDIEKITDPAVQMQLITQTTYEDGSTVDQHLSPEIYKKLSDYCDTQGIPLAMFSRFKPSMIMMIILTTELSKMGVTQEGVDRFLYKQAKQDQKPVRGLEAIEEQIRFIAKLGEGSENTLIKQAIEEMDTLKQDYAAIVHAWKTGNTDALNELMNSKIKTKYPEIYQELIVNRNQRWFPAIDACQKTPETEFILVGAAHLAGPDGIIETLKKAGYNIEKL
ncbi:MAG: TraB/GumN family protein [Pontiellaceae bacterium]|nr:TraB/GumN family protein [Pontiellaceae bacterium]